MHQGAMASDSGPADAVAGIGESDDFVEDDDGALHAQNGGGYESRQPEDEDDEAGGEGDEENPHATGSPPDADGNGGGGGTAAKAPRRTQLNHPARSERVLGIPWDAEATRPERSILDIIQFSGRYTVVYGEVPQTSPVGDLKNTSMHTTWLASDKACVTLRLTPIFLLSSSFFFLGFLIFVVIVE
jgi:hypothetical protein